MDEHRDQPGGQPSCRARRIRDDEWEAYRLLIENLYREQGSSRNVVIDRLGQEGFIVTEKQLKHILMKWGIKKKINSADMELMLATKRRRDGESKATQFTYYGLGVNESKLQRAAKRLKISTSTRVSIPSYIEVLSPVTPNRSPILGQASSLPRLEDTNDDQLQPGLSHTSTLQYSPFQSMPLFTGDKDFIFEPGNADLNPMSFQIDEEASWDSLFAQITPCEGVSFQISTDLSTSIFDGDLNDQSFHKDLPASDIDSMVNIAQNMSLPLNSPTSGRTRSYTALSNLNLDSINASCLSMPVAFDNPASGQGGHQRSLDDNPQSTIRSQKILFYGSNPENIIPSVQMMKTLIQRFRDEIFWSSHVSSSGPSQRKLIDEIRSEFFMSEIEDVTIWAHQESIRFIEQQRTARRPSYADTMLLSRSCKDRDQTSNFQSGSISQNTEFSELAGTVASYCNTATRCTTGGMFGIQLRQIPRTALNGDSNASYCIAVTAIPEVRTRREAAVRITFPRPSRALPIYTTIRTFNVVPDDSEVIRCVETNDLVGFRRLIGAGEASPLDVDSRGISLLSNCMPFLAVAQKFFDFSWKMEQAQTNVNYTSAANPLSLIDSIWNYYMAEAIILPRDIPEMKLIKDIDQCRSMTEIAQAKGCVAEDSVPYNWEMPNPLFDIGYVRTQMTTARQCADAVRQLVAAGYDKERRNSEGRTPLLFAAFATTFRSLTGLKSLLAEKVNIHAIDNHGRGALHLCLSFSEGLHGISGYFSFCRRSTLALDEHFFEKDTVMTGNFKDSDTEEDTHSDDIRSDQESLSSFAGSDNDDCFSTSDGVEEGQACCWCDDSYYHNVGELALFHYCEARDVDDFAMPEITLGGKESPDIEPEPGMCKARLRLKLLTLLRAGCNPNICDIVGASPSDYAREEGLWPQWVWALGESGWEYNQDADLCEEKDAMP